MEENLEAWKFAFQVLQFLLTGGVGVYVYMTTKDTVTNTRITKLEEDMDQKTDKQNERIARLEESMRAVPTHKDLGQIHEKINAVSVCVNRLEGKFSETSKVLNLIHETLMERSR